MPEAVWYTCSTYPLLILTIILKNPILSHSSAGDAEAYRDGVLMHKLMLLDFPNLGSREFPYPTVGGGKYKLNLALLHYTSGFAVSPSRLTGLCNCSST